MIDKVFLIAAISLSANVTALSQLSVTYCYDGAGNRISRTQVNAGTMNRKEPKNLRKDRNGYGNISYSEESDIVTADVLDLECGEDCRINVYFADGKLAMSAKAGKGKTMLDIGNLPHGVYVVSIEHDKERYSKRIMKKH